MTKSARSLALALLVLAAPSAGAQPLVGTPTGLASPTQTYDFEGLSGQQATNQYSGVTFGPGLWIGDYYYFQYVGGGAGSLTNFDPQGYTSPFDIYFSSAVGGAAFQYVTNTGVSTFNAYLNNVLVGSYSAAASTSQLGGPPPMWYGFDNLTLDHLQVYTEQNINGAMTLDNLQVAAAVPEPATVTLVATGLIGVFGIARRRRNPA